MTWLTEATTKTNDEDEYKIKRLSAMRSEKRKREKKPTNPNLNRPNKTKKKNQDEELHRTKTNQIIVTCRIVWTTRNKLRKIKAMQVHQIHISQRQSQPLSPSDGHKKRSRDRTKPKPKPKRTKEKEKKASKEPSIAICVMIVRYSMCNAKSQTIFSYHFSSALCKQSAPDAYIFRGCNVHHHNSCRLRYKNTWKMRTHDLTQSLYRRSVLSLSLLRSHTSARVCSWFRAECWESSHFFPAFCMSNAHCTLHIRMIVMRYVLLGDD